MHRSSDRNSIRLRRTAAAGKGQKNRASARHTVNNGNNKPPVRARIPLGRMLV